MWIAKEPLLSKVKDKLLRVEVVGKTTLCRHTQILEWTACLSMTAVCWVAIMSLYHRKDERKYWSCYMMVILEICKWRSDLARSYVWWPGIDREIEQKVKACNSCQRTRHNPAPARLTTSMGVPEPAVGEASHWLRWTFRRQTVLNRDWCLLKVARIESHYSF